MGITWRNCKLRHASISMLEQVFSGTVTGMRISAVDGTSFIDNAGDITDLGDYADGNHWIEIEDSEGKVLVGVLGSVGSGETLGSELSHDVNFSGTSGWNIGSGWSISGGRLAASSSSSFTRGNNNIDAVGALVKFVVDTDSYISGINSIYFDYGVGGSASIGSVDFPLGVGARSVYVTPRPTAVARYGIRGDSLSAVYNSLSVKQVLTPSTSGATIVNAINGSTQNFLTKDADFTHNAESYTVRVRRRISA